MEYLAKIKRKQNAFYFYRQKMMTMMKDEKLRTQILKEIWNVLLRCIIIHFNELKKFLFFIIYICIYKTINVLYKCINGIISLNMIS